jgi:hypothetical protein
MELFEVSLMAQSVPVVRSVAVNEPPQEQVNPEEYDRKEHVGQHHAPNLPEYPLFPLP